MDLASRKYQIHQTQALSPIRSPPGSIFGGHLHSSNTSFPILAVAIIGILTTAFLLVSYYIFVIKCCLNWHRIDILSRFSFSRSRSHGDPAGLFSPGNQRRGLEESVIQSIPIRQFKKGDKDASKETRSFSECAVCLNEFQEEEKLRAIPNCAHLFHVDCIDVWLQNNDNCPLCRTSISTVPHFPLDRTLAPSSSPQNPTQNGNNFIGADEGYVVIELGEANSADPATLNSGELIKLEPKTLQKKVKRFKHVSMMGDEGIDVRERDDRFGLIQPMRRSISMDSATDRQLYLAVQEIIQQNVNVNNEVSSIDGGSTSSSSGRIRRSFFSFGNGKGSSRSAVLPVEL
ncbi:RING-H2 finger protein ATL16 [Diospyros lotus]|uniref:RING-H2 finger protein ATL16 n=1 Tax=Diospyros lotus TaxID=55363 RepID=UPI002252DC75|nr:RING-H2 finger protein ATL16 [Diospyros lotus]